MPCHAIAYDATRDISTEIKQGSSGADAYLNALGALHLGMALRVVLLQTRMGSRRESRLHVEDLEISRWM